MKGIIYILFLVTPLFLLSQIANSSGVSQERSGIVNEIFDVASKHRKKLVRQYRTLRQRLASSRDPYYNVVYSDGRPGSISLGSNRSKYRYWITERSWESGAKVPRGCGMFGTYEITRLTRGKSGGPPLLEHLSMRYFDGPNGRWEYDSYIHNGKKFVKRRVLPNIKGIKTSSKLVARYALRLFQDVACKLRL